MTTTDVRDEVTTSGSEVRHATAWWVAALLAVLALAVGLGIGYLAFGEDSSADGGEAGMTDAEVESLMDDYLEAMNAYDSDAIRALATEDAVIAGRSLDVTGVLGFDAEVDEWESMGVSFVPSGDLIIVDTSGGTADEYKVGQVRTVVNPDGSELFRDLFVAFLIREDGELLISSENHVEAPK